MRRTLIAALIAAGGVGACVTPEPPVYGPISDTVRFGYKDRPNPDGGHTLLVVMPAHAALPDGRIFWNRRAEELCPAGVSKRNIFRSDRREHMAPAGYVHGSVGVGMRVPVGYEIEGYVYCKEAAPPAP